MVDGLRTFLFRVFSSIFHILDLMSSRACVGGIVGLLPRVVAWGKRDGHVPVFWEDGSHLVYFLVARDQTRVGIEWICWEGSKTPLCSPLPVPCLVSALPRSADTHSFQQWARRGGVVGDNVFCNGFPWVCDVVFFFVTYTVFTSHLEGYIYIYIVTLFQG